MGNPDHDQILECCKKSSATLTIYINEATSHTCGECGQTMKIVGFQHEYFKWDENEFEPQAVSETGRRIVYVKK